MSNRALWWLAAFKYFSGVTKVGCMGFLAGTVNMGLKPWVLVTISAYVSMMTFTEGFLDQTAAKIAAGKPPIGTNGSGHTQHLTLEQAKENEKTTASVTSTPGH